VRYSTKVTWEKLCVELRGWSEMRRAVLVVIVACECLYFGGCGSNCSDVAKQRRGALGAKDYIYCRRYLLLTRRYVCTYVHTHALYCDVYITMGSTCEAIP
jgi:hypothetical protein